MAAVGLVGDYTAAAARQAALNAGARVELVLAGRLRDADLAVLRAARPDIVLFSGGTDGGQARQVLANADALARSAAGVRVVVACNRVVADDAARRLEDGGATVRVVANVLPDIDRLDVEPARAAIRALFIEQVIVGKGLSRTAEFGRTVAMPTPEAVLVATDLLSRGPGGRGGLGDLAVVDVGGATTDAHSSVALRPLPVGVTAKGLPPLPLARTVQGDLGMRWSAPSVVDADRAWLRGETGLADRELDRRCRARRETPAFLAATDEERTFDRSLAVSCLAHALRRHCGRLSTVYVPNQGARFVQEGLDLGRLPLLIGTGGMLVRDERGAETASRALGRREKGALTPADPAIALDRSYVLAAAGLLAGRDPDAAFRLMATELGLR